MSLRRQSSRIRAWFTRVLLRRNVVVHLQSSDGAVSCESVATLTVSGHKSDPTAPANERIEALNKRIDGVEARLNAAIHQMREETENRDVAVGDLARTTKTETADLRRQIANNDRRSNRIDARGVPVLGISYILGIFPAALAGLPWHLGWLFPAAGVAAAVAALDNMRREP
jgi:hypothetical protein